MCFEYLKRILKNYLIHLYSLKLIISSPQSVGPGEDLFLGGHKLLLLSVVDNADAHAAEDVADWWREQLFNRPLPAASSASIALPLRISLNGTTYFLPVILAEINFLK